MTPSRPKPTRATRAAIALASVWRVIAGRQAHGNSLRLPPPDSSPARDAQEAAEDSSHRRCAHCAPSPRLVNRFDEPQRRTGRDAANPQTSRLAGPFLAPRPGIGTQTSAELPDRSLFLVPPPPRLGSDVGARMPLRRNSKE